MKRFAKSILGVTLLEIMLVLAIAAMIIVMSIRYYQSASSSEQANTTISQVQAIMAAMDTLNITGYNHISSSALSANLGPNNLINPAGNTVTVTPSSATKYIIKSTGIGAAACGMVMARLQNNAKAVPSCASGDLTVTVDNTK